MSLTSKRRDKKYLDTLLEIYSKKEYHKGIVKLRQNLGSGRFYQWKICYVELLGDKLYVWGPVNINSINLNDEVVEKIKKMTTYVAIHLKCSIIKFSKSNDFVIEVNCTNNEDFSIMCQNSVTQERWIKALHHSRFEKMLLGICITRKMILLKENAIFYDTVTLIHDNHNNIVISEVIDVQLPGATIFSSCKCELEYCFKLYQLKTDQETKFKLALHSSKLKIQSTNDSKLFCEFKQIHRSYVLIDSVRDTIRVDGVALTSKEPTFALFRVRQEDSFIKWLTHLQYCNTGVSLCTSAISLPVDVLDNHLNIKGKDLFLSTNSMQLRLENHLNNYFVDAMFLKELFKNGKGSEENIMVYNGDSTHSDSENSLSDSESENLSSFEETKMKVRPMRPLKVFSNSSSFSSLKESASTTSLVSNTTPLRLNQMKKSKVRQQQNNFNVNQSKSLTRAKSENDIQQNSKKPVSKNTPFRFAETPTSARRFYCPPTPLFYNNQHQFLPNFPVYPFSPFGYHPPTLPLYPHPLTPNHFGHSQQSNFQPPQTSYDEINVLLKSYENEDESYQKMSTPKLPKSKESKTPIPMVLLSFIDRVVDAKPYHDVSVKELFLAYEIWSKMYSIIVHVDEYTLVKAMKAKEYQLELINDHQNHYSSRMGWKNVALNKV
ncbi:hypothetical protein O9G_003713 [Rozella allomycis CSF55]|uniref:PH domain-containing protein n=1 Tax=Rozella allomycis (strain CSF55) TaxID=988480 RepID=A0A075AW98_ROZAC|nr:hypothetical protein O9G_003713 [Rozella allomycis CSF55]|eukprot:EPZ32982.1 hypothetical protein O9G_003713 [Rozella allomycis CSF55]